MKIQLIAALIAASILGASSGMAAPYVILKVENRQIDGQTISGSPTGEITIIDTAGGKFTFKREEIKTLFVDPPAEWGTATQAAAAGQLDAALTACNAVIQRYPGLLYDTKAGDLAIQILIKQKKAEEAAALAARVIRSNAAALQSDPGFQAAYWKALLATGKTAQLGELLNTAIQKGSREEAARAQLLRGDIRASENKHKEAILDYLRTAVLYEAQTDVQPEALFKTAATFEILKDSARAKAFYQKVGTEYPNSPQGQQAKGKF
ncbi:MAG: tetratricopeptide repeat protein [Kiritimatiellia bacterium]